MGTVSSAVVMAIMLGYRNPEEFILNYIGELTILAGMVAIPVMTWMFLKDKKRAQENGRIEKKRVGFQDYIIMAVMATAGSIALNNLIIMSGVMATDPVFQEVSEHLSNVNFFVQLAGLGVIVAVAEELVFRGLVYKRIKETGSSRAVVISGLIFGIYHQNLVQFIYASILGMLFAYGYEKTGKLKIPILGHCVANVLVLVFNEIGLFSQMYMRGPLVFGGAAVLCTSIASTMFVLMRNKNYEA